MSNLSISKNVVFHAQMIYKFQSFRKISENGRGSKKIYIVKEGKAVLARFTFSVRSDCEK